MQRWKRYVFQITMKVQYTDLLSSMSSLNALDLCSTGTSLPLGPCLYKSLAGRGREPVITTNTKENTLETHGMALKV